MESTHSTHCPVRSNTFNSLFTKSCYGPQSTVDPTSAFTWAMSMFSTCFQGKYLLCSMITKSWHLTIKASSLTHKEETHCVTDTLCLYVCVCVCVFIVPLWESENWPLCRWFAAPHGAGPLGSAVCCPRSQRPVQTPTSQTGNSSTIVHLSPFSTTWYWLNST